MMKRWTVVAAASTLAVALLSGFTAVCASAQAGGQPGAPGNGGQPGAPGGRGNRGGFGRQLTLSQVPVALLRVPLKLTADQVVKIKAIQDKLKADRTALMPAPTPGTAPDFNAMRANFQKVRDLQTAADTAIQALLTDDQKALIPAAMKSLAIYQASNIPLEIAAEVKLTTEQTTQLQAILDDYNTKLTALRAPGADRTQMRTQMQQLRTDTQAKYMAVFTIRQKTLIEGYLKDDPQQNFGRGGAGGPGGGRRGGNGGNGGNGGAQPNGQ